MSGPRLNKRQQQAAETRERMLQAASEVFAERGYQAASVGAITSAADTAHGTFYLYFRNKDEVFSEVLAGVQEQIRVESRAALTDDRYASLVGVISGFLIVFVRHRGLMRAFLEGMMVSAPVEANWRQIRAGFAERIAHRIASEQDAGVVRAIDPMATAQALASMTEWYAFTHLVLGDPTSPSPTEDDLDATVATLADLWYHAVYGVVDRES